MSYSHVSIHAMPDCKNTEDSYGMICVRCNRCGRFDTGQKNELTCPLGQGTCYLMSEVKGLRAELSAAKASAVQWVAYDGTPETLPDIGRWANYLKPDTGFIGLLRMAKYSSLLLSVGDRWAYLPTPPEASE